MQKVSVMDLFIKGNIVAKEASIIFV